MATVPSFGEEGGESSVQFRMLTSMCVLDVKMSTKQVKWGPGSHRQRRCLLRGTSVLCQGRECEKSSALGLPKIKNSGKERRSARESGRRGPQAVFATTVESIPGGLAGAQQNAASVEEAPAKPYPSSRPARCELAHTALLSSQVSVPSTLRSSCASL